MTLVRLACLSGALGLGVLGGLVQPATAQIVFQPLERNQDTVPRQTGPSLSSGTEASLRALDKVSGAVADLVVTVGQVTTYGSLTITVSACRFPTEDPASDAYAYLQIDDRHSAERLFASWMIASSPALSALDHARYDIWVMRCR